MHPRFMKIKTVAPHPLLLAAAILAASLGRAEAQATAFTYQAHLAESGVPASGSYDLRFSLYNAQTEGVQIGNTLTNENVAVSDGLAVVTLDFGADVFSGADRWLEVAVRTAPPRLSR